MNFAQKRLFVFPAPSRFRTRCQADNNFGRGLHSHGWESLRVAENLFSSLTAKVVQYANAVVHRSYFQQWGLLWEEMVLIDVGPDSPLERNFWIHEIAPNVPVKRS